MPKQPALPGLRNAMKTKQTRREQFMAEMDAVVPWDRLLALIAPHYLKAGSKGGRPPIPLETMLRVYFLQNWYDPEMSSTKKGNNCYFDMKAHIGVDVDSGVTHSLDTQVRQNFHGTRPICMA